MSKKTTFAKATNLVVTKDFLRERRQRASAAGYPKAKWILFCEAMLLMCRYTVMLYEARQTFSKYVTVSNGDKSFKVRFSNHKPIKWRENNGDCDFFVGVTHNQTSTTGDAIKATVLALGKPSATIEESVACLDEKDFRYS